MYRTLGLPNKRIVVADVLRGIAVAGIILYHSVEHFNTINHDALWSFPFDNRLFEILSILISGKMYSIFAILFGLSFYIQRDNQEMKGKDFSLRFLWRMILLMGFGMINTGLYDGDILTSYAIFGLLLIPAGYLSTPVLATITVILLLQPLNIYNLVIGRHTDFSSLWAAYGTVSEAHKYGSFLENLLSDLKYGLYVNMGWNVYSGRITQIPGLFFLGILLGRARLFYNEGNHLRIWKWIFCFTAACSIAGIILMPYGRVEELVKPLFNLVMAFFYISLFVLLWYRHEGFANTMAKTGFFGRMSLTNYFLQSLLGSCIFYGFGLGMWEKAGTLYSLLIGTGIVTAQYFLLRAWSRTHQRGPLESLWRKLTWIGKN